MKVGRIRLLNPVDDETQALNEDELQARVDELVPKARGAAVEAVRASMHSEFVERRGPVNMRDIRQWRDKARASLAAWREVESLCTEILNEVDRTVQASRVGMKLTTVPDGSGRPGHYKTAWVPDDTPDDEG